MQLPGHFRIAFAFRSPMSFRCGGLQTNETITKRLAMSDLHSSALRGRNAAEDVCGHLLEERRAPAARELSRLAEESVAFENPLTGKRRSRVR
jgi:hypothetical protein